MLVACEDSQGFSNLNNPILAGYIHHLRIKPITPSSPEAHNKLRQKRRRKEYFAPYVAIPSIRAVES